MTVWEVAALVAIVLESCLALSLISILAKI